LNLSRGDQTGMWMINYPFPYETPAISQQFSVLVRLLLESLNTKPKAPKLSEYLAARDTLKQTLSPDDYKYFSFQLWKEGIARYTEYRVAQWAAQKYQPTREFRTLKDFTPFSTAADQQHDLVVNELSTLKLESFKRVAFYPIGAAEGLLLDRSNPKWRSRYFAEKFDNSLYFTRK